MLFNTFEYLVFFVVFFAVYWAIPAKYLYGQNLFLLLASYIFYGWWDWRFLSLIMLTTVTSFYAGKWMSSNPGQRKWALWLTLSINFGILIYFKYAAFFVSSFTASLAVLGIDINLHLVKLLLPVGISFYTFQSLSYVIDVYRGKLPASRNLVEFAAFVSFFPQLVAGPIERAGNLLPQIQRSRTFNNLQAEEGLRLILWGLVKKMLVADNCAPVVEQIFSAHQTMDSPALWFGAVLFAFQIYCDFSAYSEIAMGSGKLLGIELMQNFNYPYFAKDIKEFWKKWHISLTTWFKDYVFLPMGGSRGSKTQTIRNVAVVFLLSGLWHGANLTFVVWGIYHALLYLVFVFMVDKMKFRLPPFAAMLFTFFSVLPGWVYFRSGDLSQAFSYFSGMFQQPDDWHLPLLDVKVTGGLLTLLIAEWWNRNRLFGLDLSCKVPMPLRWTLYGLLMLLILIYGSFNEVSFIYFNF
ncbi:MAG: MBOAT family protein [Saprospiraceae bacterium]|nr:MBOAT family protein [Saprospiraceae bacterium]